jgi:hypothetical protein
LARFSTAGKVGFFDRRGRVVIVPRFTYALPFSEGRAAVCEGCAETPEGEHRAVRGGRWGFINRRGRLVVPLQFDEVRSFQNGRAQVRVGANWRSIGKAE